MSSKPVFKAWVPEWLIRIALLLVILPGIVVFALSVSNAGAAAGYYGISPNDVQYSLILLYAAMAGFIVLEGRFFKNIATREYLIAGVILLQLTCYACYSVHAYLLLLILRFIQGMLTCGTISITLTLMFSRLHNERSREIGYSVVYGILLSVVPFVTFITAPLTDAFDFNVIYKVALFSYAPGAGLMFVIMNQVRVTRKMPLYQLDWASFVLYASLLSLTGFVLIYGQQYEWLDDKRICLALTACILLVLIFVVRQFSMKRPYLYLQAFTSRSFIAGVVLLFVFYICRGSFGLTTAYMSGVLGLDPIHMGYLFLYNIGGIVVSVLIASRLVLAKKPMRLIFIYGFSLLLFFHVCMYFIFSTQVDSLQLILPLILQGMGAGMLMVPIILFLVSAVPASYGSTGSAVGIFVRFLGFCSSMALINFFQLSGQSDHINRFQEELSSLNPLALQKLELYRQGLMARGAAADQAAKISTGLLSKSVAVQAQLRFDMDYYQLISLLLLAVILVLALYPGATGPKIKAGSTQPAAVGF